LSARSGEMSRAFRGEVTADVTTGSLSVTRRRLTGGLPTIFGIADLHYFHPNRCSVPTVVSDGHELVRTAIRCHSATLRARLIGFFGHVARSEPHNDHATGLSCSPRGNSKALEASSGTSHLDKDSKTSFIY